MDEIRFFRITPDCFSDNMLSPTGIKLYYRVNKKFPDTHIEEDPTVKAGTQLNICVSDSQIQCVWMKQSLRKHTHSFETLSRFEAHAFI